MFCSDCFDCLILDTDPPPSYPPLSNDPLQSIEGDHSEIPRGSSAARLGVGAGIAIGCVGLMLIVGGAYMCRRIKRKKDMLPA